MLKSLLRTLFPATPQADTPPPRAGSRKLNLGCGRNVLPGWLNLDAQRLAGVDIVADLGQCATCPLPLAENSIDEFLLSHVLEHIRHPLPLMQELWRVASPGALMTVRVPFGATDDAFEDPTHVRQYFLNSFNYFAQPTYCRADYGYRGDWQPERLILHLPRLQNEHLTEGEMLSRVMHQRNVVQEMVVLLRSIKPLRSPQDRMDLPDAEFVLV